LSMRSINHRAMMSNKRWVEYVCIEGSLLYDIKNGVVICHSLFSYRNGTE